jgi:hypothetical protein
LDLLVFPIFLFYWFLFSIATSWFCPVQEFVFWFEVWSGGFC